MLTASEKRWLIYRRKGYCRTWCKPNSICCFMPSLYCPTSISFDDYREAAEFEAQVVAKLARQALNYASKKYPCRHGFPVLGCMRDKTKLTGSYAVHCEDCFLREARLQVEEEMDADRK